MAGVQGSSCSSDDMSDYACDVSLSGDRVDPEMENEELDSETYEDFDVVYVGDDKQTGFKDVEAVEDKNFEERFKDKPHPLLIPSIVYELGTYMNMKDLERLRSVHPNWNKEFCKVLRKVRTVEFVDAESVGRYMNRMKDTMDYPHTSFELMQEDIPDSEPNLTAFFAKFGPHIKSLTFGQISPTASSLCDILQNKVPNLESMVLYNHPRRLAPQDTPSPDEPIVFPNLKFVQFHVRGSLSKPFITDLLRMAPNIVKISHLRTCTGPQPDNESIFRETILLDAILEMEEPLNSLSFLDFRFNLKDSHVEALQARRTPFMNLDLVLDPRDTRERLFSNLMEALRSSLRNLVLNVKRESPYFCITRGASLCSVTSLTLTNYKGTVAFVEDMPQLRFLNLDVLSLADAFPLTGFSKDLGPTGHQLVSFSSQNDASSDFVVDRISSCFPNLKKLHLGMVNDEGMIAIYQKLPFITDLHITRGTFTDCGISGVPSEVCKDLWETRTFYYVKPEYFRRSLYIGCLTNLCKVSLESNEMTDLSVIFGLSACTKVRFLQLKSPMVTDVCIPLIGQYFRDSLTTIDLLQCRNVTEGGHYILGQKLPSIRVVKEIRHLVAGLKYQRRITDFILDADERQQQRMRRFQEFERYMVPELFRAEGDGFHNPLFRRHRHDLAVELLQNRARDGEVERALLAHVRGAGAGAMVLDGDEDEDDLEEFMRMEQAFEVGVEVPAVAGEPHEMPARLDNNAPAPPAPPQWEVDVPQHEFPPPPAGNNNNNIILLDREVRIVDPPAVLNPNFEAVEPGRDGIPPTPPPFV